MFLRPWAMIRSFVALAPLLVILAGFVSGPALSQNNPYGHHDRSGLHKSRGLETAQSPERDSVAHGQLPGRSLQ